MLNTGGAVLGAMVVAPRIVAVAKRGAVILAAVVALMTLGTDLRTTALEAYVEKMPTP